MLSQPREPDWMARYIERPKARPASSPWQRMAVLPGSAYRDEWRSVLRVTGCEPFHQKGGPVTEGDVVRILLLDPENPASIHSCLVRARPMGDRCAPSSPRKCGRRST